MSFKPKNRDERMLIAGSTGSIWMRLQKSVIIPKLIQQAFLESLHLTLPTAGADFAWSVHFLAVYATKT